MGERNPNDLQDNSTLTANLSQGSYEGRSNSFTHKGLSKKNLEKLDSGKSVKLRLNPEGKPKDLYLQSTPDDLIYWEPDGGTETIQTIKGPMEIPTFVDTGHKGLLQDPKTGFSAYLFADTKTLNKNTKNTYIAVRGSDGIVGNLNDWFYNYKFVEGDGYTKQAQETKAAISHTLSDMKSKSPKAKLTLTGHSLGTINTIEALSQLSEDELARIDRVDLYDGPDGSDAIKNIDPKNLKKLKKFESKINYYINPFDMVSMLNRSKSPQIGKVHYILPVNANGTMGDQYLKGNNDVSAHDFGQIQHKDGEILLATMANNPEAFLAGKKLSNLVDKRRDELLEIKDEALKELNLPPATLDKILEGISTGLSFTDILSMFGTLEYFSELKPEEKKAIIDKISILYDRGMKTYNDFNKEYKQICQDAQDLENHVPLRAKYAKELEKFRKDWTVKLRKKLTASGGGLSTNEKVYLDEQESLFATQHYRELLFRVADKSVRDIQKQMKEVEKVWPDTVKNANEIGRTLTPDERLSALEAGGATKTTVVQVVNQHLQSDVNEINAGRKVYEDFIKSIEKAMENLLAKDQELAQQIEAAEQP